MDTQVDSTPSNPTPKKTDSRRMSSDTPDS